MSEIPFQCSSHHKKWQIVCQLAPDMCVQCCVEQWRSSCGRKGSDLLKLLSEALSYGSQWSRRLTTEEFTEEESQSLIVTITGLLFDCETKTQMFANNCLKQLLSQMNVISNYYIVFELIFQKIHSHNEFNVWTLDMIYQLLSNGAVDTQDYPLKQEIFGFLNALQKEFHLFSVELKSKILQIFNQFYDNLQKSNELFGFEEEFHFLTLQMLFNAFEQQNSDSNDENVLMNSIQLIQRLSTFPSIHEKLICYQNFADYLKPFLTNDSKVKLLSIEWISNLLEVSHKLLKTKLSNDLMNQSLDLLLDLLSSSDSTWVLTRFVDCINLILGHMDKPIPHIRLISTSKAISKSIFKSLEVGVDSKDNDFFMSSLTALKTIIKRNGNRKLMTESEYFRLLDCFQHLLSDSVLSVHVVHFLPDFIDASVVPTFIPNLKMKSILQKLFENIDLKSDCYSDGTDESIVRVVGAVNIIKAYINFVINVKNNRPKESADNEVELNLDSICLLNEQNISEVNSNQKSDNYGKQTVIYESMRYCLLILETFFTNYLQNLTLNSNPVLFSTIIPCFSFIIESNVFPNEDIIPLITRMFSNGYALQLIQLLSLSHNLLHQMNIREKLASLLALFLFKIADHEHWNDVNIQYDLPFDRNKLQKQFSQVNVDIKEILDRRQCCRSDRHSMQDFFITFFGVNYYCVKLNPRISYDIDGSYGDIIGNVLNQYFKYYLSGDQNSILSIKYSLFLSAFAELETKSIENVKKFLDTKSVKILSLYYSNHIIFIEWLFNTLYYESKSKAKESESKAKESESKAKESECHPFLKYAFNAFFHSIPENYLDIESKDTIISFLSLIIKNKSALKVFVDIMSDPITEESTLQTIQYFLNDCEFIDDSNVCNIWHQFRDRVFKKLPKIIHKLIDTLNPLLTQDIDLEETQKLDIFLKLFCQMAGNVVNNNNENQTKGKKLNIFLKKLVNFMAKNVSDSITQTILQFLRLCFTSSAELGLNEETLTAEIIDSKVAIILITSYIDSDSTENDIKENSLHLLSVLAENQYKYHLKSDLRFELNISEVTDYLFRGSKDVTESVFRLLISSFDMKSYLPPIDTISGEEVEEIRDLLWYSLNDVFKGFISLDQMTSLLNKNFNELMNISKYFKTNSLFFVVKQIVDNYVKEREENNEIIFTEELIDFLLFFCQIYKPLSEITDQLMERLIQYFNDNEVMDSSIDNTIRKKALKLLKAIK